ncbi:DUF1028 domain-containing protein [Natronolimnobius sp. AArcel1]|uniref:DUF1028 domain-containing protein n=1 Tax=Natronolimnobius sp. AArcel1 TaxID=1679093 RepID=UPI0013ECCCCD|nr:DUF1028 domain-containing protein [Natronolimnobius sp. AArcel1]NGM70525.1 DUF1028 domain-containing protein [Natronolimnobius sp. AArcel1]
MTYSICATDGENHGVAIATKAIGVGSTAPFLSRNGVVATQSMVNTPIGVKSTRLLDQECSIDNAVETLLEKDDDASHRQVHGVDQWGNSVVFSGNDCVDWFGHIDGETYTVAGNMLAGPEVVEKMSEVFERDSELSLDERLLAALRAGEEAGGDKRRDTAQSCAIKVYDPDTPSLHHDIRVDEHDDAIRELHRIHERAKVESDDWVDKYPEVELQRWP